jgi:FMN phosphatase YigB (HAD superfamily)
VGFEGIFDSEKIALSCRYGVAKDDAPGTMFKALEKEMSFPKEQYLFIDDRAGNLEAGLTFGVVPIYFPAEAEFGHIYIKEIISKMIKQ